MNMILSTTLEDHYKNFVVVKSYKDIIDKASSIENLIIHTFNESDFESSMSLTKLMNNFSIKRYIYISSKPKNMTKSKCITCDNMYFFEDDFYLDDEEELVALIDSIQSDEYEETGLSVVASIQSDMNILKSYVNDMDSNSKKVFTPLFKDQVKNALSNVETSFLKLSEEYTILGNSYNKNSILSLELVGQLSKSLEDVQNQFNELCEKEANNAKVSNDFSNNIWNFTPYNYMKSTKAVLFREHSPCRYFTSFILGYYNYLAMFLNKKVKLIFVHQRGADVASKYNLNIFNCIDQNNIGMDSLFEGKIIATNNPKKEVLDKLFSNTVDNNIFIIIDRLYSNNDIVKGRIARIDVASSRSDIARYNLRKEDTIFTTTSPNGEFMTIPKFNKYPVETDARQSIYHQNCANLYEELNKRFRIE